MAQSPGISNSPPHPSYEPRFRSTTSKTSLTKRSGSDASSRDLQVVGGLCRAAANFTERIDREYFLYRTSQRPLVVGHVEMGEDRADALVRRSGRNLVQLWAAAQGVGSCGAYDVDVVGEEVLDRPVISCSILGDSDAHRSRLVLGEGTQGRGLER
ncbi:hypothetical protein [Curtobacterium sp. TXMA1]|uniref:hypothetical protein n=1 Tax=Curtobacterium sp. TXMA1 TaxID=2876939 RepID=UPI001CC99094|nr:hypothetical protein [Curtobacterium sp. TXMA1]UBQ01725.1 hypothetical protein LCG91_11665 [Curtobacterium sp. TXMA1]